MCKKAVILAGGKGNRLKPYTVVLPKPLMPIGDYSILEVIILQLVKYGFTDITITVNHQADVIMALFGDGSKWKVKIDYSLEDKPLGTIAPLRLIEDLPENFLIMNGDVLTDLDYGKFYEDHICQGNLFTISSCHREHNVEYGVLEIDESRKLTGFSEKPKISYLVSMGIYMANKAVLKHIPEIVPYGFDRLMLDLLSKEEKVSVINHEGLWWDIGNSDDYLKVIEGFDTFKERIV